MKTIVIPAMAQDEEKKQERLAKHRIQNKKYRNSARGKRLKAEYDKKYRDSAHGKRVRAEYAKKYRGTEHGRQILRKCIDKYQENRICFSAADHSRFWLPDDSIEANFMRLIKREFRTTELIGRIREPDKDMIRLMRLAKKLLPVTTQRG